MGMGCLFVDKHLNSVRSFYCPMNDFNLRPMKWGETIEMPEADDFVAGGENDRGFCRDHKDDSKTSAGYTYNPHNRLTLDTGRSFRYSDRDSGSPGKEYSNTQAVLCMDILSPNFYDIYPFFNHSDPTSDTSNLTDRDVRGNLLQFNGGVSEGALSEGLLDRAKSNTVDLADQAMFDAYIGQMIYSAGSR